MGNEPILPRAAKTINVFCAGVNPAGAAACDICTDDLSIYAENAFDWVFISKALEALEDPKKLVQEAATKLRPGGHLLVFLPISAELSTTVISSFTPESVDKLVASSGGWKCKGRYTHEGHLLQIYKKVSEKRGDISEPKPPTPKRVCIVRYGAFGDMIMITPLIRAWKNKGYHVTVNCTSYSKSMLNHNPFVDNIICQEREGIPNPQLGEYWDLWKPEYDEFVNLSESIEGKLLAVEGRAEFYSPKSFRQWRGSGKNYYDFTMELGGCKGEIPSPRGELYFSPEEERWARDIRKQYKSKFLILYSLTGSSFHKIYGLFEPVMTDWLNAHPNSVMITCGDQMGRLLEFDHPRLVKMAGAVDIRKIMCLTQHVDLVMGPETGILNAAGCFETPKIVMMSHSAPEDLTKHWLNTQALTPDPEIAKCFPCKQLHYSRESCPTAAVRNDTTLEIIAEGPVCAMGAVSGEVVHAAITKVYTPWYATIK
jgi:ADP-heptose:LPS heptosyltransferase